VAQAVTEPAGSRPFPLLLSVIIWLLGAYREFLVTVSTQPKSTQDIGRVPDAPRPVATLYWQECRFG
jgi:hypothetical protein